MTAIVAPTRGGGVRRIAVVLAKELRETLRDRRTLLVLLLSAAIAGPLFLMLIFNMIANQASASRELRIAVDGAERAPALIAFLEREQATVVAAPGDYEAKIAAGEIDLVLAIDAHFADDTREGKSATVRVIADRSRDRARPAIEQTELLLRLYNRQTGQSRLLLRGIAPEVAVPLNIEAVDLATPQQSGALLLFLIAFYGLFAALMGGMGVALDITAGERERASLEPLLTTPATPFELIAGKWLAASAVNLIVVTITLAGFYLTLAYAPLPSVGVPFLFASREFARFMVILLPIVALMPAVLLYLGARARTFKEAQANVSLLFLVVSLIPVLQLLLQRREPAWIALAPVAGQYTLLRQALRGEAIANVDLAASYVAPALLTLLALAAVARLYSRESILAGR
jgi:sodium transport system permease protein